MKKVLTGAFATLMIGAILTTATASMIIAPLANNNNVGVFVGDSVQEFQISGTQSGYDYNLTFTSLSWSIEDIKLSLGKKNGIVTTTVPLNISSGSVGEAVVAWAREREKEGKWKYVYYGSRGIGHNGIPKSKACPICHPKKNKYGWQCVGFVTAAYFHGAGIPSDIRHGVDDCRLDGLHSGGIGKGGGTVDEPNPDKLLRNWRKRNGKNWDIVTCGSLKRGHIPKSDLQIGDILLCYNSKGYNTHTALYAGDGRVIDCSSGNGKQGGIKEKDYTAKMHVRVAMRYTGAGGSASGGGSGAQGAVAWAKQIAADDSYTYGSFEGRVAGCYVCGTRSTKHYSCMPFVTAAFAHGAGDPDVLALCRKKHSFSTYIDSDWKKLISKGKFQMVGNCKDLSFSNLQEGDILVTYAKDDKSGHMSIYAGGDDLVEAVKPGNGPESIRVSVGAAKSNFKSLQRNKNNFVMRYTGGGGVSSASSGAPMTLGVGGALGGTSHSAQDVINGACAWAEAIAADDTFHYGKKPMSKHNGCYFCGTQPSSKKGVVDYEHSYCCNPFVHAAFAHGGGEPKMLKICKRGSSYGFGTTSKNSYHNSKLFKRLGKPAKSALQRGDVLCRSNHVALYLGNGKFVEASGGDDNVKGSKKWKKSIAVKTLTDEIYRKKFTRVYRYIGSGGGVMELPEGAEIQEQESTSTVYTKKPNGTVLDTITAETGNRVKITNGHTYTTSQSFAAIPDGFAVAFVPGTNPSGPGEIRVYDSQGKYKGKSKATLYHANGSCGTTDGGMIVAGSLFGTNRFAQKFTFDGHKAKLSKKMTLPVPASAIAYDKDTGNYICSSGTSMKVTKDLKSVSRTLRRYQHKQYYQDIGAGGGYIFAVHCISKFGKNYLDVYDEKTGDFCGSYYINYGEVESVEIVNGEIVLLVHQYHSHTNYIHFTGIGGNTSNSAVLTINYGRYKDGRIVFRGTLNGASIIGEFNTKKGNVSGKGYYGGTLVPGGMVPSGDIGNPYGESKFYIMGSACAYEPGHTNSFHDGWDLAVGEAHAPIYAVGGGKVVNAGPYGGYGNHVVIIQNGNNYTLYGHMSAMTVNVGDTVSAGQQIGNQGNEGHSFGNHLHLEFRKGKNSNTASTANLSAIKPMFMVWAKNGKSWNYKAVTR